MLHLLKNTDSSVLTYRPKKICSPLINFYYFWLGNWCSSRSSKSPPHFPVMLMYVEHLSIFISKDKIHDEWKKPKYLFPWNCSLPDQDVCFFYLPVPLQTFYASIENEQSTCPLYPLTLALRVNKPGCSVHKNEVNSS